KIKAKDISNQYNYLEIEMQLCYPHYLSIIEPDQYDKNKSSANSIYITESSNYKDNDTLLTHNIIILKLLSFGDKITLITKVLYEKQRKENQTLELNLDIF
ncbi:3566_t:CDS:1, partial [Cetraspora pellucida]